MKPQEIKFYKPRQLNGFLSNFYPSPFTIRNTLYPTNQHYYQSKKYEGKPEQQLIIEAKTPKEAFELGRKMDSHKRNDWQAVKEDFMYEGLKAKFSTHEDLKQQLLETGNAKLIEHTQKDTYWADGGHGSGKNRLGTLLMRLRFQIRNKLSKKEQMVQQEKKDQ